MIGQLMEAGLLHAVAKTVAGDGLELYRQEPKLIDGRLTWVEAGRDAERQDPAPRPPARSSRGRLKQLTGNLGPGGHQGSAVAPERHVGRGAVRIFHDQDSVKRAFKAGEFTSDVIVVVRSRGRGPMACPNCIR